MNRYSGDASDALEAAAAHEEEQARLHAALRDGRMQPTAGDLDGMPLEDAKWRREQMTLQDARREAFGSAERGAIAKKFQGDLGEQTASSIAVQRLGLMGEPDFTPGYNGLDGVYRDENGRLVLLEAKFTKLASEKALASTRYGQQMSPEWIARKAELMRNEASALYSPGNARVGVELLDTDISELRRVVVHIDPATLVAEAYEADSMGHWQRIDTWSALEIESTT